MPKYCKESKLQGHNEVECRVLHPELHPMVVKEQDVAHEQRQEKRKNQDPPIKILSCGKVVGNNIRMWNQVRDNRPKKDQ